MKKNNPHTPIMLREALDTQPRIFARYGMHGGELLQELWLTHLCRVGQGEARIAEWWVDLILNCMTLLIPLW